MIFTAESVSGQLKSDRKAKDGYFLLLCGLPRRIIVFMRV
jgi:hypothetical protein